MFSLFRNSRPEDASSKTSFVSKHIEATYRNVDQTNCNRRAGVDGDLPWSSSRAGVDELPWSSTPPMPSMLPCRPPQTDRYSPGCPWRPCSISRAPPIAVSAVLRMLGLSPTPPAPRLPPNKGQYRSTGWVAPSSASLLRRPPSYTFRPGTNQGGHRQRPRSGTRPGGRSHGSSRGWFLPGLVSVVRSGQLCSTTLLIVAVSFLHVSAKVKPRWPCRPSTASAFERIFEHQAWGPLSWQLPPNRETQGA